jgi:arylsulfatase A-like enzyme
MLTGRYHLRSGAIGTGDARSTMGSLEQPTIAELFQEAGYQTGMFGKWHLGANTPFLPENRGFAEVVSYGRDSSTLPHVIGGGGKAATKHKFRHNGHWEVYDGYRTDVWFNELSRFVRKNRERPFFAYLATWSTHGPNQGPAGLSEKYRKKLTDLGDAAWGAFDSNEKRDNFLELAAEMEVIDGSIGRLLELLDELGLRENTIVVYTSDGSGAASPPRLINEEAPKYPSACPAIISWPGGGLADGTEITELIANIDMAPTFLDLCGITPSRKTDFDGQSAYGLLHSAGPPWQQRVYIADHQSKTGDRRVVLHPLDDTTVYMPHGEVHFVDGKAKGASPALEARARQHWEAWWKDVTSDFQPYQYAVVGTRDENPVFLQHAYTESAASETAKRYVMPVEFARGGTYVFASPYDDPSTAETNSKGVQRSRGHLMIDDVRREGDFPMTIQLQAGRKLLRASLDGKRSSKALRIERIDDPSER